MKSSLFRASALAATLLFAFSACKQDPASTGGPEPLALNSSHGSTTAKPAFAYMNSATYHNSGYNSIWVMDSDGTHQTNLFPNGLGHVLYDGGVYWPSWSPSGGSIAFLTGAANGSTFPCDDSIYAVDVSLNSSGVPVSSNLRFVYGLPQSDSTWIDQAVWSSTSTVGKIAFSTHSNAAGDSSDDVWVISQTGGTPVHVWHDWTRSVHFLTWSPDDSKLCFNRVVMSNGTAVGRYLMIFSTTDNGSSWSYTDSIYLSLATYGSPCYGLEWSRSGMDEIAFCSNHTLYYVSPTTGSTPSTNSVSADFPTWDPGNGTLAFTAATSAVKKVTYGGTTTSTIASSPFKVRWRHTVWPN